MLIIFVIICILGAFGLGYLVGITTFPEDKRKYNIKIKYLIRKIKNWL